MHESVFVGEDRRAFVLKYCQRGSLEDLSKPLWKNKDFLAPSALLQFFRQVCLHTAIIKKNVCLSCN